MPPITGDSLLRKYRPLCLAQVVGQTAAVEQLTTFAGLPYPAAFLFDGPTGVGKTAAAKALAYDIGCTDDFEDMGGITEIPSGQQDGKAVASTLQSLRLRPMYGSGWKVCIVNEADCMTTNAENIWLDGLERLPPKTVVVFTTNEIFKLAQRFIGRCEVVTFDGASPEFVEGMHEHVRKIWKTETGKTLDRIPDGLGRFEMAADTYSIRLAVQQIAPLIRAKVDPPATIKVPFVRSIEQEAHEKWVAAGRKAAETKKRNLRARAS